MRRCAEQLLLDHLGIALDCGDRGAEFVQELPDPVGLPLGCAELRGVLAAGSAEPAFVIAL